MEQQSLLQTQQQREIAEKGDSERHQHSRQDVWTFPEGSSVMAQNVVPLITSNHLNQTNANQAMLPTAMNASANKGIHWAFPCITFNSATYISRFVF